MHLQLFGFSATSIFSMHYMVHESFTTCTPGTTPKTVHLYIALKCCSCKTDEYQGSSAGISEKCPFFFAKWKKQ